MTEPVVEIRGLHFARGERVIFDGIDLDIEPGGVTAIMGPSGTGKTTLLKLIGGQLRPQSGSIRVFGEEVTKLNRQGLFELRKKMGMLFQSGALLTDINVFENVAYPMREHTRLPEAPFPRQIPKIPTLDAFPGRAFFIAVSNTFAGITAKTLYQLSQVTTLLQ